MTTTNNNQETLTALLRSAWLAIQTGQDIVAASEALENANAEPWIDDMTPPPGLALIYAQRDLGEDLVSRGEALEALVGAQVDSTGIDFDEFIAPFTEERDSLRA